MFKQVGKSSATSKSFMRVVLLNALSLGVAMDSKAMESSPSSNGLEVHVLYKLMVACACTFLFMLLGFLWITAHHGSQLQQRLYRLQVDCNLKKVLEILKRALKGANAEGGEEEPKTNDPIVNPDESGSDDVEGEHDRYARYQQSSLEEISDNEFWRFIHHGKPDDDEDASAHRTYTDAHIKSMMRETNDVLNARIQRLRRDYENAELVNDVMAMDSITDQIHEAAHLRYSI